MVVVLQARARRRAAPLARGDVVWGYGHYFVFAAVAALGAGLQVAADTTHDATAPGAGRAAPTVAIPVAIYLVALAVLHARRTVPSSPDRDHRLLVIGAALAATWIGVPASVVAMGILVSGLLAINIVTIGRLPA